jgi:hypothetical protein
MSSLPSLLNPRPERRRSKYFKYGILGLIVVLVLSAGFWYFFRFHPEESAVDTFMEHVVSGQFQDAYHMWQGGASYKYEDFLQDWGPNGYYGPVRSYRVIAAHKPKNASGVIIVVDVSPFSPFPSENDFEKARRTKEARIWVQSDNRALSDSPF